MVNIVVKNIQKLEKDQLNFVYKKAFEEFKANMIKKYENISNHDLLIIYKAYADIGAEVQLVLDEDPCGPVGEHYIKKWLSVHNLPDMIFWRKVNLGFPVSAAVFSWLCKAFAHLHAKIWKKTPYTQDDLAKLEKFYKLRKQNKKTPEEYEKINKKYQKLLKTVKRYYKNKEDPHGALGQICVQKLIEYCIVPGADNEMKKFQWKLIQREFLMDREMNKALVGNELTMEEFQWVQAAVEYFIKNNNIY